MTQQEPLARDDTIDNGPQQTRNNTKSLTLRLGAVLLVLFWRCVVVIETNPSGQQLRGVVLAKETSNHTVVNGTTMQPMNGMSKVLSTEPLVQKTAATTKPKVAGSVDASSLSSPSCTPLHPSRVEFIHIPKTGGTSIEVLGARFGYNWGVCNYMARILDAHVACPRHGRAKDRPIHHPVHDVSSWHMPPRYINNNNKSAADGDRFYDPYQAKNETLGLFLVVRNPYDRIVSEFKYREGKNAHSPKLLNAYVLEKLQMRLRDDDSDQVAPGPSYFMNDAHLVPQSDYLPQNNTAATTLHILHTEHLRLEWPCLVQRYGLPPAMANMTSHTNKSGSATLTRSDLNRKARALVESVYAKDFEQFGYQIMDQETDTTS